jgi:hypothetical protein
VYLVNFFLIICYYFFNLHCSFVNVLARNYGTFLQMLVTIPVYL